MKEKKALFIIDILLNVVGVYFNTFFVFYFFQAANYEILPLVKYYFFDYISTGIFYFLIRKAMKKNIKVPYFQIGISLQAMYIALIMLLKENIVHFIFILGIIKGLSNAFYYYPRVILESEKVDNENRQQYEGKLSTINQITAIIIPLLLGILLTYFSYTDLGKVFFLLFIIMFILAFNIKDGKINKNKFSLKEFKKITDKNKSIKTSLFVPFLSGFTYSSGVMILIATLLKINIFKTNFNLGLVDSICAFLCLLVCFLYSRTIKEKHFTKLLLVSGILSFLSILLLAFFNNIVVFIIYLIIRFSAITAISLVSDTLIINLTNNEEIKNNYKSEYYCMREIMYSIARSLGYLLLFVISIIFGSEYISYILILPGIAIFIEVGILYSLAKSRG